MNTDEVILTTDSDPGVRTKTNTSEDVMEGILTVFDEVLSKIGFALRCTSAV